MIEKKLIDCEMPLVPYMRLNYSWDMILCLEDFIQCIKIHKKDLKSQRNRELMRFREIFFNDKEFNPAGVLWDYIYLEANSFFQHAKKLKNKGDKNMPDLPNYLKELKKFRDEMVGHRDAKEKNNSVESWIKLEEEINKLLRKRIVKDVDTFYEEVISRSKVKS